MESSHIVLKAVDSTLGNTLNTTTLDFFSSTTSYLTEPKVLGLCGLSINSQVWESGRLLLLYNNRGYSVTSVNLNGFIGWRKRGTKLYLQDRTEVKNKKPIKKKKKKGKWKPASKVSYPFFREILSIGLPAHRDIYVIVQFMHVATISIVVFICLAFCQKGCF